MDMENYGDDFKVASKGKRKPYEVEYESLSQQAVEKLMQRDVDHICGIFGVEVSRLDISLPFALVRLRVGQTAVLTRFPSRLIPRVCSCGT